MKRKILFVAPDLKFGGAQSVFIKIVNYLFDKQIFDLKVVLLCTKGEHFSKLNNNLDVICFNKSRSIAAVPNLVNLIKNEKPDVVFSIVGQVNIIMGFLSVYFKNTKFIGRENNVHSNLVQEKGLKAKLLSITYKIFLKKLDKIVVQSQFMKAELNSLFKIEESKIEVIYNPADFKPEKKRNTLKITKKLIAIGRLEPVKNYVSMLKAFSKLNNDYSLTILGDGREKEKLKKIAEKLQISNRVDFQGYVSQPDEYLEESSILLLTSIEESFPNVVLEANSMGVFCVSYNMKGGISEIINENNGILVEMDNDQKLADAIEYITMNGYSPEAVMREMNKFQIDEIMFRWINLFKVI